MLKLFKGDLLIFTPNGFKRAEELNIGDLILSLDKSGNIIYEEIEEITKTFKKKYNLNKIEGYYINNNIDIYSINNIPTDIDKKNIFYHLDNYKSSCINQMKIGNLFLYDYIGFPININESCKNSDINFKEVGKDYTNCKLTIIDLFNLSKDDLNDLYLGLAENSDIQIDVTNRDLYHLIKYTCLFSGNSFNSNYKDGKLFIKFTKNDTLIYDNFIWTKIKSLKKINNFTGNLLHIKLKSNNPYLSDIGFIS